MIARLFMVGALFVAAGTLLGQQDMGYITGRVIDSTSAVVPEAAIVVVETQTGDRTVTKSTATGDYTAGPLKIGNYDVTVEHSGFKTSVAKGIVVHAQDRVRVDFTLEVGQVTEVVSVTAEAPLLQTSDAGLGQAVANREIGQLPLNSRNFQSLALLAAGVMPAVGHRDRDGGFNAHGQRATENIFLIDGIDNKSSIMGMQDRKSQVMLPSLDAVQEFKVDTGNYSAEFGSSAGTVMNVSVKSGTNQLHGSAYEYLRNDAFDARDTFNYVDRDGDGKADPEPLRQNQFGVTLGGPVRRNRTFYFGSWEGHRIRHAQAFLVNVPTAQERRGVFDPAVFGAITDPVTSQPFPSNTIPQNRWDPVAAKLIDLWPSANFTGSGTRANYVSGPPWSETRDQIDARVDNNFTDYDKVFFRFSFMRYMQDRQPPLPLPARGAVGNDYAQDDNYARTYALSYTKLLSPTLINEFRFGFRRLEVNKLPSTKEFLADDYGIKGMKEFPSVTGLPRFTFTGRVAYQGLGEAFFAPNWKVSQGYQYIDNITWIRGAHTIKFGGDIRFNRSDVLGSRNAIGEFQFNGRYTGVSFADFLLGMVNQYTQSDLQITDTRFRNFMFYVQDEWKLTSRLTANVGVRYELNSPLFDKFDRMNKIVIEPGPDFGKLLYAGQRGSSWSDRALVNTDTNNIAPRIGFAYRIGDKWAVRSGFGIFYSAQGESMKGVSERMAVNWPVHVNKVLRSTPRVPALVLASGVPDNYLDPGTELPADIQIQHWATNFPALTVYQWNTSLQRQLTNSSVLKLAYVGSATNFITDTYDWNAPGLGSPATEVQRRVFPAIAAITLTSPYGHGSYHGLDTQFEKRFSHGFSMIASYTWSHTIDNVDELYGSDSNALQDKDNWDADRGSSGYDITHRFVTSYVWDVPFGSGRRWLDTPGFLNQLVGGWQLSGITLLRTGQPFTPSLSNAREALGTSAVGTWRPDRIRDGSLDDPTPDRWFDPTAFVRPCATNGCRYGNSGRNILREPGQVNFDAGIMKFFPITERVRLQFRGEAFNVFNTPAFGTPATVIDSPDAGTIRSTTSSPRILQFALRMEF